MSGGENDKDDVGYKRPPKKHRFKPGQSGNSKGRPRKLPRVLLPSLFRKDVLEVMDEIVEVKTSAGAPRRMTMQQLIIRGIANRAAKGDKKDTKDWMVMARDAVQERYDAYPTVRLVDMLMKIVSDPRTEPDSELLAVLEAHIKAIKDLL